MDEMEILDGLMRSKLKDRPRENQDYDMKEAVYKRNTARRYFNLVYQIRKEEDILFGNWKLFWLVYSLPSWSMG